MDVEPVFLPGSFDLGATVVVVSVELALGIDEPGLGLLGRVVGVSDSGEFHLVHTTTGD